MALETEGKVIRVLSEESGVGASSGKAWRKRSFVIETFGDFPKKICISAWNDRVDTVNGLKIGDLLKISFRVESREYNERWYTDITASRIEPFSSAQPTTPNAPTTQPTTEVPPPPEPPSEEEDDLPF